MFPPMPGVRRPLPLPPTDEPYRVKPPTPPLAFAECPGGPSCAVGIEGELMVLSLLAKRPTPSLRFGNIDVLLLLLFWRRMERRFKDVPRPTLVNVMLLYLPRVLEAPVLLRCLRFNVSTLAIHSLVCRMYSLSNT